ncbi:hypothetical protein Tco_0020361 [Tanacetum coccineum]
MASSITRFDIKKFDGKSDFGLWQIKMSILMVQQGCDAALKTLPADMEAGEKATLMKKAYSTLILCLEDRVLREVTKETTVAGIWTKLTSLYMTKSLANRLYLKKKLYTYYISPDSNAHHIGQASNSPEKNMLKSVNIKVGEFIVYIVMSTISQNVSKKGKHDQDSDSSDDEGNTYFGEALVVVGNDEMAELVIDSGGSYHMTHRRDFLYDFKVVDGGLVQLGDNRTCTIKGTGKVKIQLHDGSSFILEDMVDQGDNRLSGYDEWDQEKELCVSNDDATVAQRRLEDKQLEEKTNTDCLVKEQEKVHLGIKVGENITVIEIPGQEGAKGNVAEKEKVKDSIEANIGILLKYNAWSTRWSPVRGETLARGKDVTKHASLTTNVMSPIWFKNCTGFAIGERHLPIESTIASRSTDVMVEPQ